MNVLSLFDGISCGRLALQRAGIPVSYYFASEVDDYAIATSKKNWPSIRRLGDVRAVDSTKLPHIDLLLGGSPCQGFSFAGGRLNFDDPRSKLFFEFARLLREINPRYFLLENVPMDKKSEAVITEMLGVKPVAINSALVSAQNRKRLYWANFKITQPKDKGIMLADILLPDALPVGFSNLYGGFGEKKPRVFTGKSQTIRTARGGGHIPSLLHTKEAIAYVERGFPVGFARASKRYGEENLRPFTGKSNTLRAGATGGYDAPILLHTKAAIDYMNRVVKDGRTHWDFSHHSDSDREKSAAVVANFFKGVPYNVLKDGNIIRKFAPIECERLQTLPDNYTEGVSNTQRYRQIGNGWTVDVVAHILRGIGP
jgi:DNA (cytosine-5)-methyltransferase 3A